MREESASDTDEVTSESEDTSESESVSSDTEADIEGEIDTEAEGTRENISRAESSSCAVGISPRALMLIVGALLAIKKKEE